MPVCAGGTYLCVFPLPIRKKFHLPLGNKASQDFLSGTTFRKVLFSITDLKVTLQTTGLLIQSFHMAVKS